MGAALSGRWNHVGAIILDLEMATYCRRGPQVVKYNFISYRPHCCNSLLSTHSFCDRGLHIFRAWSGLARFLIETDKPVQADTVTLTHSAACPLGVLWPPGHQQVLMRTKRLNSPRPRFTLAWTPHQCKQDQKLQANSLRGHFRAKVKG